GRDVGDRARRRDEVLALERGRYLLGLVDRHGRLRLTPGNGESRAESKRYQSSAANHPRHDYDFFWSLNSNRRATRQQDREYLRLGRAAVYPGFPVFVSNLDL